MTFVLVAVGSYGDVLPFVGLGREFLKRGHQVVLCTNGHFAALARQAGLTFVPLGSAAEYDRLADNPALWYPHKGWRLLMKQLASPRLREAYRTLCSLVIPGETILVSSTLGFAARLIQETQGVPNVTVHLSPGVFQSASAPPKMANLPLPGWLPIWFKRGVWSVINHALIDPLLKPYLNAFRRELGLAPVSKIFHTWAHSPDLVIGMFPDWFAPSQPDWPHATVLTGFPWYDDTHDAVLPGRVQAYLESYPQPIVITPGSANKHGRAFFKEAAEACRALGRPALLLTRYPEQLPQFLSPSIQHFSYVPLSRLLPHCSALIHHGGIGTCAQALRAGTPQLIQPLAFDQFDNAARIERLGVGRAIGKRSFRARTIMQHLEMLLSSSEIRSHCQEAFRRAHQDPGLSLACQTIESRFMAKPA